MLRLEEVNNNALVSGLETGQVVRIVTTERIGDDTVTVYYKTADGGLREQTLFRSDEANLSLAEAGCPWAFDALGGLVDQWQDEMSLKFLLLFTLFSREQVDLSPSGNSFDDMQFRLESRQKELAAMRRVVSATPVVMGGALIIPARLLAQRKGEPGWSADAEARRRIEQIAMKAVMDAERATGNTVYDVSAEKCGWDVTSLPPAIDGKMPPARHIEVKGRAKGAATITVTRNEILNALNQQDKFVLAIVLVEGDAYEGPYYIQKPFTQEPDWAVTSVNLDINGILERAIPTRALPATQIICIAGVNHRHCEERSNLELHDGLRDKEIASFLAMTVVAVLLSIQLLCVNDRRRPIRY